MTSTHFTTGTTITSEWLNDVNDAVYEGNITAEGVQYTAPFTGAVGTNVELKLAQTVSVKDFGAVADWNGSTGTDNTAAFQAALDSGFGVYVPDGYYKIEGVLKLSNGDYIFGNNPNGASFGGTGYPQSAHLIFTTSGSSCFQNNNPLSGLYHGGVSNLSIETSTRDWIFDLNGTLGFEFIGLRLENQYATGGGLRSTKINPVASNPTWLNRIIGVEIRVPDASTAYSMSIDWSDSDFSNCGFTGGKGVFDSGPGNNKYNNCIFDRANTSGAGLTLTTYDASRKPTVVTGCCFDANDGYGLILDGTSVAGGTFSPSIVGCSFRNYTTGVSYEILLKNTYGSPCFGGTITGCSFTQEQRTPINFDSTIWQRLNWVGNYHAYTFSQIVAPDTNDEYAIFDRQGSNVPSGIGMFSGSNTIRGMSNVSTFAGANLNDYAGLMTGCINQNSPFVAASLDKNGTATQLNFVTDNTIRLQVTADGQSLLPYTDNYMQLGYYGRRMSVIFAATGTINTSDANEKTNIRLLDHKEKAVALAIKARIKAFKFKDAVEKKGNDARIHFGVLAQEVKEAFEAEGLIAEEYGVFCSDTWVNDDGVEQTRLGVRYDELFAFLMGAI